MTFEYGGLWNQVNITFLKISNYFIIHRAYNKYFHHISSFSNKYWHFELSNLSGTISKKINSKYTEKIKKIIELWTVNGTGDDEWLTVDDGCLRPNFLSFKKSKKCAITVDFHFFSSKVGSFILLNYYLHLTNKFVLILTNIKWQNISPKMLSLNLRIYVVLTNKVILKYLCKLNQINWNVFIHLNYPIQLGSTIMFLLNDFLDFGRFSRENSSFKFVSSNLPVIAFSSM